MNGLYEIATAVAQAIHDAGIAVLGETLYVGRIPAEDAKSGLWAVSAQGGQPEGGNISKWKTRSQLQVMVMLSNDAAQEMYDRDALLRKTLVQIPFTNDQFANVLVSPLQDNDAAESELRVGVWNVETVTINTIKEE